MSYLPGKFIWFEHTSNDVPKARAFYQSLFGWHTEKVPMNDEPYEMIQNGANPIGGFRAPQPGELGGWLGCMSVTDVDGKYAEALAAGAKPLQPPKDFVPMGRGASFTDPIGAAIWIWKSTQGDSPETDNPPANQWCWSELWTQDDAKALAFYEKVFGYRHETMPGAGGGPYHVIQSPDGKGRGGVMKMPDPQAPTRWCPYVLVEDCDATVKKAEGLGAQVMMPSTDIPNVGRIAVLIDPLKSPIALIKPAPMAS